MANSSEILVELFIEAARAMNVNVNRGPHQWVADRFNIEHLSPNPPNTLTSRADRDLPQAISGLLMNETPVLLGALDTPDDRDVLRRYRNQASIARSWLGAKAPNLHLFIMGPPGSREVANWRYTAAKIEADDRVCRKLVWLPPDLPEMKDATDFLDRTFLARPWESSIPSQSAQLDRLAVVDIPSSWIEALDDETLDSDSLVAKLIEADKQERL
jgi:hypothetical protein